MGVAESATQAEMGTYYPGALKAFIQRGIELELLAPNLAEFDLDMLGEALEAERDLQFTYLGLQTLYDRYFIHSDEVRFELQIFMRVAMGLRTGRQPQRASDRVLSTAVVLRLHELDTDAVQFDPAAAAGPCYLTTVPDDLFGIYGAIQDNAMLSKFAGSGQRLDTGTGTGCLHQRHQRQKPGHRALPESR